MGIIKIKKPKAFIFDVMGTTVKTGYIDKILLPYAKLHVASYLNAHFEEPEVKDIVHKMRKKVAHNKGTDPQQPAIAEDSAGKDAVIASIGVSLQYTIDHPRADTVLHQRLKKRIWKEGFAKQDQSIKAPVYADVVVQLKKWKLEQDCKFFIFSHATKELQVLFMTNTNHGELETLIDGHYDPTLVGPKNMADSYKKILEQNNLQPIDVVFLSKNANDAKAAESIGIPALLVLTHRVNIEKLTPQEREYFKGKIVRSFNEIDLDESGGGVDLFQRLSQIQQGGPPPAPLPNLTPGAEPAQTRRSNEAGAPTTMSQAMAGGAGGMAGGPNPSGSSAPLDEMPL